MNISKPFLFCVLTVLTTAPVCAADNAPTDSLFFSSEETRQIETLMQKTAPKDAAQPDIHLGAVMYYGPGDWSVWLQGERWIPETQHDAIKIMDVAPDQVKLEVIDAPGASPHEITLRPYHTYRVATGAVVEGTAP